MTYDVEGLKTLVRLTFQAPRTAARALIGTPPPRQAVWLVIWLESVLFALLLGGSALVLGDPSPVAGPVGLLITPLVVVVSVLVSTLVLSEAGRVFGGKGTFWDVLLTSVWLSLVNVGLTVLQLAVSLVLPPLAGMLQLVLVLWLLWIAVAMLQEVHGFASFWPALGAYVLAGVMTTGLVLLLGFGAVSLNGGL